jgi:hypothetical protein
MNVEALSTPRGLKGALDFLTSHPNNLTIVDESTTIKIIKLLELVMFLNLQNILSIEEYLQVLP